MAQAAGLAVMKRVLVIGSGGAGKSTFARRLGAITGIPVVHLDKLYWKPNWTEPSKEEWQEIVLEAVRGDSWIMDGNYGGTLKVRLDASDTLIFLDMPRHVCVWRVLKRFVKYRRGGRPDMTEGCNESLNLKFIKWIWDYSKNSRPKIEKLLESYSQSKTIVCLRSNKDIEKYLQKL